MDTDDILLKSDPVRYVRTDDTLTPDIVKE